MNVQEEKSNLEKLDVSIKKVDWGSTTNVEREAFSMSMIALELASTAKKTSQAVSKGRLVTLIACILLTGALMAFSVEPGIILGVTISAQMLLFGMSQILEYGCDVLVRRAEIAAKELVEALARRHPLKEGSDDTFIL